MRGVGLSGWGDMGFCSVDFGWMGIYNRRSRRADGNISVARSNLAVVRTDSTNYRLANLIGAYPIFTGYERQHLRQMKLRWHLACERAIPRTGYTPIYPVRIKIPSGICMLDLSVPTAFHRPACPSHRPTQFWRRYGIKCTIQTVTHTCWLKSEGLSLLLDPI